MLLLHEQAKTVAVHGVTAAQHLPPPAHARGGGEAEGQGDGGGKDWEFGGLERMQGRKKGSGAGREVGGVGNRPGTPLSM